MKILEVTTHVTIDDDSRFTRNRTGFGYMVYDIAKYIAKKEQVDLFCTTIMTEGVSRDKLRILRWNWYLLLSSFRFGNIISGLKFINKYPVPGLFLRFRILFFYLLNGYLSKIINDYDVIHIHGCTPLTEVVLDVCRKIGKKCLVTLHGLNSIGDSVNLSGSLKQYERDFLKKAVVEKIPLSFISSGDCKNASTIGECDVIPQNWYVISNGCNIVRSANNQSIRSKYNIDDSDFLYVYVGNISKNKNQIAVAKAYSMLPIEEQKRIKVIFVGNEADQGELSHFINSKKLNSKLLLAGFVPKEEVHNYYYSSNATILVSIQEGFGLSIIEGFVYGKPNVTYTDLSSVPDVYNDKVMLTILDRSPKSLAKALIDASHIEWNIDFISQYSKQFSLDAMADKYLNVIKNL